MSLLSWKTKNNRMRNSTKLRQITESWNPKDLKRKKIESEEGKKHKKKKKKTEETVEEEEIEGTVEEKTVLAAPKRWNQRKRWIKKFFSRRHTGNKMSEKKRESQEKPMTRNTKKKEKPPNFSTSLSQEQIEEDLRAMQGSRAPTRPKKM